MGQTIKKLRKKNGWTQEELAAKLNISAQAVSKWETDLCSPDISQIVPLTTLFGVSRQSVPESDHIHSRLCHLSLGAGLYALPSGKCRI
ncbi:MAG: helix-turn-helix transcriptional regulator [Clostridia bacterium]|nr:helix-turn-helix transcriptional regulator [Clostridia bacterium]